MSILVLNARQVRDLLPPDECADLMRQALTALAHDEVHQPLRTVVRPPDAAGIMALMPTHRSGDDGAYGLKAVCVFHHNPKLGKDAHQGAVLMFSAETGELMALANASAITEIRTAAVSGVATDLLARKDSTQLAIIGAGVQARAHLAAMADVRPITRARVAARDLARTELFVAKFRDQVPMELVACASAEEAVAGADIVVTATSSHEPVLRWEWLAPGTHVNAVGSSIPVAREIDTATMAGARLFVDRRESTINESGDYLMAHREGAIGPENIVAEIGDVLIGAAGGRTDDEQITLFKSLGLAVEDLAAVRHVYLKAKESGAGTWVDY
jgi:ornithine cyclodeaminase/alanine dehydrogenase-like protein (mu-crystallin family)